jgi:D-alanyl-D-alanine carboxypeptidase (penicillin-binding protein 5/6)
MRRNHTQWQKMTFDRMTRDLFTYARRYRPLWQLTFTVALIVICTAPARAIETQALQAILVDFDTGTILFEKNADELMAPASMTKIMTADLVFDRLEDGRMALDDKLNVSENAWRKGGSKMFVKVGTQVSVKDLLRGIVIQSGNDASIVVAEAIAGSEEAFARLMTDRAHEIGMKDTTFRNATGWPDPQHLTTAHDLAKLAAFTIRNHPNYYHFYGEKSFTYNDIKQGNRNPLLYKDLGADGLKTGHTEVSGYGLTASAKRGDRRLILVINGLPDVNARSEEGARLLNWGFREFDNYRLFDAGEVVETADVWLGQKGEVPLVLDHNLVLTLPRAGVRDMKVTVAVDEPVAAPIKAGDELAQLVVDAEGMPTARFPLFAGVDVPKLGFTGRVGASLKYLVFGAASPAQASAE